MNALTKHDEASAVLIDGRPEGQLDYETRCNIRDLVRLYGFERAREMVANFLNDEANREYGKVIIIVREVITRRRGPLGYVKWRGVARLAHKASGQPVKQAGVICTGAQLCS